MNLLESVYFKGFGRFQCQLSKLYATVSREILHLEHILTLYSKFYINLVKKVFINYLNFHFNDQSLLDAVRERQSEFLH